MPKSSNSKPMRGKMISGSDGSCGCCSDWGETRASDKREWNKEVEEQLKDLFKEKNK